MDGQQKSLVSPDSLKALRQVIVLEWNVYLKYITLTEKEM